MKFSLRKSLQAHLFTFHYLCKLLNLNDEIQRMDYLCVRLQVWLHESLDISLNLFIYHSIKYVKQLKKNKQ